MKTKLTLNINDRVIERAKKISAKKRVSLSSIVEEFLVRYAGLDANPQSEKKKDNITQRIRKLTKPVDISDAEMKKMRAVHLQRKYGK